MRLKSLVFIFFFSIPGLTLAGNDSAHYARTLHITYDNDFFTATDYYYTQGIRIETDFPFLSRNPLSKTLLRLPHGRDEAFGISINQQCFTPTSIREDRILDTDRPFAGAIFLGLNRVSAAEEKKLRLASELDLGGAGPCSSCQQTQESIHTWLHNVYPHGWQFQVRNGPVINYSVKLEKGFFERRFFDARGFGDFSAGTLYSNAGAGFTLRAGRMDPYFRPFSKTGGFRLWVFAGGDVHAIGYDATLEGAAFSKGNSYLIDPGNIERLVWGGGGGIVLSYRELRVEYAERFLSPEFRGGLKHAWGHCNVSWNF